MVEMKLDHLADIHAIDMVRPEHRHDVRFKSLDKMEVLIHGVGCALVPGLSDTLLRWHRGDKILVGRETTKPPTGL